MAAKAFAAFTFVLALLALLSFWPPTSADVIMWLVLWVGLCVATSVAILGRYRYATWLVWALLGMGIYSAVTALRSGMLNAIGIVIDIVLFVPLVWFAMWYQRAGR
jgi:hypothetical protein